MRTLVLEGEARRPRIRRRAFKSPRRGTDVVDTASPVRRNCLNAPSNGPETPGDAVRVLLVGAPELDAAFLRELLARSATMRFELTEAAQLRDAPAERDAPRSDVVLLQIAVSDLSGMAP